MVWKDEIRKIEYHKKYHKTWYSKNRNKRLAQKRIYRQQPSIIAAEKHYREQNKDKTIIKSRKSHLKRSYKLSLEEYENLNKLQKGACAICKNKTRLCVDHDHSKNRIRGLLCNKCNVGISMLQEKTSIMKSAIKYLNRWA